MTEPTLLARDNSLGPDDLVKLATRAEIMLEEVRNSMLAPHPTRVAPEFSTTQVTSLCGINKARLNYLIDKEGFPQGAYKGAGRSRVFSLKETREWIKLEGSIPQRPAEEPGQIIGIANFKGGSTKTSTAMTLAQGLTLRGRRVLLVDLDPQASLTTLCGLLPDKEVSDEMTVEPYFAYQCGVDTEHPIESLESVVIGTYWDGLDLIPASNALFGLEFSIPSAVISNPGLWFWTILEKGLRPLTSEYDVIIIDTAPALSYVTINAMCAADGLLMPLPLDALDFASSTQFWGLFADLISRFNRHGYDKRFLFANVLPSKVDMANPASSIVRDWAVSTYGDMVLPVEIPKSSVINATAAEFSTVYDVTKWEGGARTYQRAREAFDRLVELVDQKLMSRWGVVQKTRGYESAGKRPRSKNPGAPQMNLFAGGK